MGSLIQGESAELCGVLHCKKSFNVLEYRRRLQNGLLPTNEKLMQIAQIAKTTKKCIKNKSFRLMFWSGQSSDLKTSTLSGTTLSLDPDKKLSASLHKRLKHWARLISYLQYLCNSCSFFGPMICD